EVAGRAELDARIAERIHGLEHPLRRDQVEPSDRPLPHAPRHRRAGEARRHAAAATAVGVATPRPWTCARTIAWQSSTPRSASSPFVRGARPSLTAVWNSTSSLL